MASANMLCDGGKHYRVASAVAQTLGLPATTECMTALRLVGVPYCVRVCVILAINYHWAILEQLAEECPYDWVEQQLLICGSFSLSTSSICVV
jgi:hypothetical protein